MYKFIAKRIGISVLILWAASLLIFVLTINSGDPLEDLRESNNPNRENLMQQRSSFMGLDLPWYERYWTWLTGAAKCFIGQCDLGVNRSGQSVNDMLGQAASATLRLVLAATFLAIFFGIFFGVMSAIRRYTGFDYVVTFLAFTFYSLPAFVFAVLLKEYGAIRFNDWLADPTISLVTIVIFAGIFALFVQALVAGGPKRRAMAAGISFAVAFGVMEYISVTRAFLEPTGGLWIEALMGLAGTVLFTGLFLGFSNKRGFAVVGANAAIMFVIVAACSNMLWEPTWGFLFLILALGIAVSVGVSYFFGGYARRSVTWASIWAVFSVWIAIIFDFAARYWSTYLPLTQNRPISTIGSMTPNFQGSHVFWLSFLDSFTHLLLPTISLTLMSIASYTRYTRSSMLEVLGQDYIRTARAKGLPEHTVITRHSFRNAMLPLLTIIAFDFAGLIGGAVITETVFGWKGMGELFRTGLAQVDPAPVMAFFLVTGGAAVLMNMVADIMYAYVDPRIRR